MQRKISKKLLLSCKAMKIFVPVSAQKIMRLTPQACLDLLQIYVFTMSVKKPPTCHIGIITLSYLIRLLIVVDKVVVAGIARQMNTQ